MVDQPTDDWVGGSTESCRVEMRVSYATWPGGRAFVARGVMDHKMGEFWWLHNGETDRTSEFVTYRYGMLRGAER